MNALDNPLVVRLFDALNGHDLDAVSSCFGPDFSGEWPAHPGRDFRGPEQVRRNWEMIFKMSPELTITVTDAAEVGDDVWAECHYTKAAGQDLKGVIIITVRDGLIRRSRFFMEPIDAADAMVPGGPRLARD
jgi:ketosteroid isomerase-like protein